MYGITVQSIGDFLANLELAKDNYVFFLAGVDENNNYSYDNSRLIYSYEVPYYQELGYEFYKNRVGLIPEINELPFEEEEGPLDDEIKDIQVNKLMLRDLIDRKVVPITGYVSAYIENHDSHFNISMEEVNFINLIQ